MKKLEEAIMYATDMHRDQVDKTGEPYILHPLTVMMSVPDKLRIPAVLHDIIEDTGVSVRGLSEQNFVNEGDMHTIRLLTRGDDEHYDDYIERLAGDDAARAIKIADLKHNLNVDRILKMTAIAKGDLDLKKIIYRILRYQKALRRLENGQNNNPDNRE